MEIGTGNCAFLGWMLFNSVYVSLFSFVTAHDHHPEIFIITSCIDQSCSGSFTCPIKTSTSLTCDHLYTCFLQLYPPTPPKRNSINLISHTPFPHCYSHEILAQYWLCTCDNFNYLPLFTPIPSSVIVSFLPSNFATNPLSNRTATHSFSITINTCLLLPPLTTTYHLQALAPCQNQTSHTTKQLLPTTAY